MQLFLVLFLTVATAGAIAQQYSTASDSSNLPATVQRSSSKTLSSEGTPAGDMNLPDAPSYAAQQKAVTTPPAYKQVFSSAPNTVPSRPLIFSGDSSGGADTHQPNDRGGGAANCGRVSSAKSDGGWFNSLLSATSKSGHYCALGEGGFWKRGTYAMGRAFAAHKYDNVNSFTNPAEFFGSGMTSGSASFNPYQSYAYQYDAGQRFATRYATAVGRDTLRNMFREFWPDFSSHVLNRRP
jgi:hypothetical protein